MKKGKKILIGIVAAAVITAAAAGFCFYHQVVSPSLSLEKTAEALKNDDGYYDITWKTVEEGKKPQEYCELNLERDGSVFGGTVYLDDTDASYDLYFDMDDQEIMLNMVSIISGYMPDGVKTMAEKLGMLTQLSNMYITGEQIAELTGGGDAYGMLGDESAVLQDLAFLGDGSDEYDADLVTGEDVPSVGKLATDDNIWYRLETENTNAVFYVGCPKEFDEYKMYMYLYMDYPDSNDQLFELSLHKVDLELAMPENVLTDDQIETLKTLYSMFGDVFQNIGQ